MKFRRALGRLAVLAGCSLLAGCVRPEPPSPAAAALPSDAELCQRIDRALQYTYGNRRLNTRDQAAWQVVHGALCFGRDYQIEHEGRDVKAIDYLLAGGTLTGWTLRRGDHGLDTLVEPGSKTGQGHEDQWLGYLSQVGLPLDQPIVAGGQTFTVGDLLTQAQWDIYDGMEATWTLMAASTYLPVDATWPARDGTLWSLERIASMEADQDLNDSACGGTHRMYALTVATKRYLAGGGRVSNDGQDGWSKASRKIRQTVAQAREYQQPDGSFSADYFVRPGTSADIATRIGTTGHTLEFLMVALEDDEVNQPWVARAVAQLVGCFEKTERIDLECGALYHAARGLALYRARRFGHWTPDRTGEAGQPTAGDAGHVGQ